MKTKTTNQKENLYLEKKENFEKVLERNGEREIENRTKDLAKDTILEIRRYRGNKKTVDSLIEAYDHIKRTEKLDGVEEANFYLLKAKDKLADKIIYHIKNVESKYSEFEREESDYKFADKVLDLIGEYSTISKLEEKTRREPRRRKLYFQSYLINQFRNKINLGENVENEK